MRKHVTLALASAVIAGLCCQSAPAQLPGGLKIPKVTKPKPTTASQPAPSNETPPAARPQPGAPPATTPVQPAPAPQAPAGETTLVMTRIRFWPETQTSYKGEYNDVWSWIPSVEFTAQGPGLPSGAKYYVEVAQPGGAPWVRLKCESNAGGTGYECGGRNELEKEGTLATGVFPFTVKMRNPLEGTEKTLFTGRAKVEKVLSSEVGPTSARKFVYYTNQDWNLPIGQVYLDNDGRLGVRFWIRGEEHGDVEGHLFYKGEEVGLFEKYGNQYGASRCSPDMEFQPTRDAGAAAPQRAKWARMNCPFLTVAAQPNRDAPEWHIIGTNAGEYEVKVLRNKRLARSLKFSIGPDGKFVDNRIASGNGITWDNFLFVPVTVVGDSDGTWDRNAWKTDAFYGHPLNGFNWPPQ